MCRILQNPDAPRMYRFQNRMQSPREELQNFGFRMKVPRCHELFSVE
jgi:hypothetical protein